MWGSLISSFRLLGGLRGLRFQDTQNGMVWYHDIESTTSNLPLVWHMYVALIVLATVFSRGWYKMGMQCSLVVSPTFHLDFFV